MKDQAIGTILGIIIGVVFAWVGGYDFDERGGAAEFVMAFILFLAFAGWVIGTARKENKP